MEPLALGVVEKLVTHFGLNDNQRRTRRQVRVLNEGVQRLAGRIAGRLGSARYGSVLPPRGVGREQKLLSSVCLPHRK